jgi:hypothetical protein
MLDPEHDYFPDFDDDSIIWFALPFCRLMFAYANIRLRDSETAAQSHDLLFPA